jgi:sulfite exporter TauE/SafE
MNADLLLLGGAMLSGLAGSGHCALMCGGIATSFNARSAGGGWLAAVEPNLGRVLGYALAGAAAGGIGHGIVELARMQSLERGLRAAAGLVLVIAALRLYDRAGRLRLLQAPGSLWRRALAPLQRRLCCWPHGCRPARWMARC